MKKIPQKKKSVEDAAWTAALDLLGHHAPAIIPLIHHTGIERDLIAGRGGGAAGVRLTDFGNAGNGIGPGAELEDGPGRYPDRCDREEERAGRLSLSFEGVSKKSDKV